ncbi:MAG: hypothetical protein ACTS5R_01420 [Candidatus Hodgkinia cicadicola]
MRISSNFGKGRGGGDCVWFGGEGEIGWDDNAACCGWFDGKREWSLLSKWLGGREREDNVKDVVLAESWWNWRKLETRWEVEKLKLDGKVVSFMICEALLGGRSRRGFGVRGF